MNIIAVDDEYHALEILKRVILEAVPDCGLQGFDNSADAIRYATGNRVDVAFLDVRIDEMTGLQIAQKLKELHGDTNIIFVTGYDEYMRDALRMHVSGYLEKPVSVQDVAAELRHLRNPIHVPDRGCVSVPLAFSRSMWTASRSTSPAPRPRSCWPIWWTGRAWA